MTSTLVSTVKNEAPYLWEWVAYHRMIGFDYVIIFQNDSTDGTHEILAEMAKHGLVRYRYNRAARGRHQVRAYQRAARHPEYADADWIMALDLDEFLVIHAGDGKLADFFSAVPQFDCAQINWSLFGCSGHIDIPDGLVIENFVMCEREDLITKARKPFKSLFRRSAFERPGVHNPVAKSDGLPVRRINGSGLPEAAYELKNFQSTDPEMRRYAQINHYVVKDVASFILKNDKGSAHQADRKIDHKYWRGRNKNQQMDLRIAGRAPELREAMKTMDALTGGRLSALTRAAVEHHRREFLRIGETADSADLLEFCRANLQVTKRAPLGCSEPPTQNLN
ncbi:MAG: glycosyltransferase family 2 protein [Rhodobacteraceae bacterium]|nr:glycosyltransferase family 2 protein [Paracoccaceae bacterium]